MVILFEQSVTLNVDKGRQLIAFFLIVLVTVTVTTMTLGKELLPLVTYEHLDMVRGRTVDILAIRWLRWPRDIRWGRTFLDRVAWCWAAMVQ
jgi:hypothetical protein